MESGYAEDAGRKEPKFGTMQDGDGYDPCAVCGSYPVVNVRGGMTDTRRSSQSVRNAATEPSTDSSVSSPMIRTIFQG